MSSTKDHPVWTVYDRLRTACLNVKYYGARLQSVERQNMVLEGILLAAAPTSAIAGLWFWNTEWGKPTWQVLGVLAAIAAVMKPLLGLTKRIKDYEAVLQGYRTLEYDLIEIKAMIEQKKKYDQPLQAEFKKALQRERTLVAKTPESVESKRVRRVCQEEVLQALPPENFFIPED
jgi:hypothetical protein